jgi:ADP-ribose pyrophosphatase YjhB (NUDIX family)
LIKHRRLGTWLPVGGEIELRDGIWETPLEAAKRELSEETGLAGRFHLVNGVDGTPLGFIGYEEHPAGSKGLHMNFVFAADVDTGAITACDEITEHRWVEHAEDLECPQNVRELVRAVQLSGGRALIDLARVWLDAFNRRDLDKLLSLYADDAVHTSPKLRVRDPSTNGEIRGKAALRAWWADSMTRLPGLFYEERHLTADGERVWMEYLRKNPGEESYMVAEVLVVEGGLIKRSHVYHG